MTDAPDYDAIEALGALAREETFRPGWPYQGSGEWTENVIGMLGGHTGNFAGAMSPDVVDALIARCRELEKALRDLRGAADCSDSIDEGFLREIDAILDSKDPT